METAEYDVLAIDEAFLHPLMTQQEAEAFQPLLRKFTESYIRYKDSMPLEKWLPQELKEELPEYGEDRIIEISSEIFDTIKASEEKKHSLELAVAQGRSKDGWFASEVKTAVSQMEAQSASQYLAELDGALHQANDSLMQTLMTQSGTINRNPHLDGFIAEQYHAQTFNLNAAARQSPYRAEVLQPAAGETYTKNSVDIVIKDANGSIVKRYQSKYYKDTESTLKAFRDGNYRGQQKLIPADQADEIVAQTKATDVIVAPDGTCSTPLTKIDAKQLQAEAQSGKWNDLNWNEYAAKDVAIGVGKQAGQAALLGAAVGIGFDLAQKAWNGEPIDGGEVVETALTTGADFGIKAAAAGALKVGTEKGIISAIPKGTPAGTIANIAFVAIEDAKILGKMATGELTWEEGRDKLEQTTVATTAGIMTSAKSAGIGATIGTVFGPVGTFVGGLVGGTVGYIAGSKIGETVVKGVQTVRKKVKEKVKEGWEKVKDVGRSIKNGIRDFFSVFSW